VLHRKEGVERNHDGAHLVALGEDELLRLTALERVDHAVELTHGVADRPQLVVGDLNLAHSHVLLAVFGGSVGSVDPPTDTLTAFVTFASQFPSDVSGTIPGVKSAGQQTTNKEAEDDSHAR